MTNTYLSIVTLDIHRLNATIKRHRMSEWIKKKKKRGSSICCLQETHFRHDDTCRLKVRGWRNMYHANGHQKKARIAILLLDTIEFKTKTVGAPERQSG